MRRPRDFMYTLLQDPRYALRLHLSEAYFAAYSIPLISGCLFSQAAWRTGAGVGIGLAFALAHGVANLLVDASPDDPAVFASITATIAAVAIGSSWLPVRRASRIDPMVALRDE